MLAFSIWLLVGLVFMAMAVYSYKAKKAVNPWANTKRAVDVHDVEGYNKSMARLFFFYALVFIILGLPLLAGQNSALVIITILGLVFETIFLMIGIIRVEEKYRKYH